MLRECTFSSFNTGRRARSRAVPGLCFTDTKYAIVPLAGSEHSAVFGNTLILQQQPLEQNQGRKLNERISFVYEINPSTHSQCRRKKEEEGAEEKDVMVVSVP